MTPVQKEKTRDVGAMLIQFCLSLAGVALISSVGWLIKQSTDQTRRDFEQDQRINREQYRNDTDDLRQQTNDRAHERIENKLDDLDDKLK